MTTIGSLALFAALVLDGKRVADVYTAGDDETFLFEANGARIGEHWWKYDGQVDLAGAKAHHFEGGARVDQTTALGKLETRETGDLYTDDRGHPLRLSLRISAAGTLTTIEATFVEGKATLDVAKGASKQRLERAVPPDAFALVNQWVGMVELVGALEAPPEGAPKSVKLFAVEAAQTIDFELRDQGAFDAARSSGSEEKVEGRKYRDSLGELLMVEKSGKLFELAVPSRAVKIRHPDPKADVEEKVERFVLTPPKLVEPDFAREPVVVANGATKLAGTVTKRKGASGRLPAVFFVSGSGPQDREGYSGAIDLGTHELLDRLTADGFLVLRVDDRGVGESSGPLDDTSYDDLVADARACVDFLLARDDVEKSKLFVIGHSEGGETAPILACERPLAGIVLMAPPGRSMFEILREQKTQALVDLGLPKSTVDDELAEHAKALALLTRDPEGDDREAPKELRLDYRGEWRNRAWYRSHAKHDPVAQVKLVKCPVLIAQGELDRQVSSERDAPVLAKALAESGNRDVTTKLFPKLDHLFKKVPGEKPSFGDYFTARPLDPEFLDVVSAWLVERAKRSATK